MAGSQVTSYEIKASSPKGLGLIQDKVSLLPKELGELDGKTVRKKDSNLII